MVANTRFLILPNVKVSKVSSHIVGSVSCHLGPDWQRAYGYKPVLLDTFVGTGRFTGASYRAANRFHVGQTKGRSKLNRSNEHALPVEDIHLYLLQRNYQRILTAPARRQGDRCKHSERGLSVLFQLAPHVRIVTDLEVLIRECF